MTSFRRPPLSVAPLAGALALALAAIGTPVRVAAEPVVAVDSDRAWGLSPTRPGFGGSRTHVELRAADGSPVSMPIVVLDDTPYVASMREVVSARADPDAPGRAVTGPERRLTLGVDPRPGHDPSARRRDKVQLSFSDATRRHDLQVDVHGRQTRYIAFDVQFDPSYTLSPNSHYVIHFQALQTGMGEGVEPGTGRPPFSIRVRGTNRNHPDPHGPIDLQFVRGWWDGGRKGAQQQFLPDRLPPLDRGRWYRLVLKLRPGLEDAAIGVWHWDLAESYDRCDAPVHQWRMPWGYWTPPSGDPATDARRRTIQYGLGIYRLASPAPQRLHLRNIRYGRTFDDVAPGRPCPFWPHVER